MCEYTALRTQHTARSAYLPVAHTAHTAHTTYTSVHTAHTTYHRPCDECSESAHTPDKAGIPVHSINICLIGLKGCKVVNGGVRIVYTHARLEKTYVIP